MNSIEGQAQARNLANLQVITCDVNELSLDQSFDRIFSIEMFEHLRNYASIFNRVASWMKPQAKFFVHVFCHQTFCYFFETEGSDNWMGRNFFTHGIMPSLDLLPRFSTPLVTESREYVSGTHYARTAEAWHSRMLEQRTEIISLFERIYGVGQGKIWFHRWRIFFLACAELFAYDQGNQWGLGHYLFCAPKPNSK